MSPLKSVIKKIVHKDQTGFIKDRFIANNIRRTLDIIQITQQKKIQGAILSINFDKCYDRIKWFGIKKALTYFNFGDNFMNMIHILYKDPLCCSMNYGFTSEWWSPQQAIRQGCSVSPLLYDITVEVLLCYLHDESKINFQGLTLHQIKHKLAAFADDLHLYINIESDSLEEITTAFDNFERCTGLKVSYDKSSLYRMSVEDGNAQMYTTKLIKWDCPPFRMLGVNIDFDAKQMSIDNFNCVLEKVCNTCKLCSNRNLSLIGKIKIVNNLMTSQYVYQMISLNLISDEHVKEFNQTINNYLWKNRKPKIPLKVLQLPVTDGGLGLIDICKKDIAMKVQWVKCMIKEDNIKDLASELLPGIGSDIWKCNLNEKDADDMIHMESFWKTSIKMLD